MVLKGAIPTGLGTIGPGASTTWQAFLQAVPWEGYGASGAPMSQLQPHPAFFPPRVYSSVLPGEWGTDSSRYPSFYPFMPGTSSSGSAVIESDSLRMSHIPQMRAEFARIRRDDLQLVHFLDEFATVGGDKRYENLNRREKQRLVKGLRSLSVDLKNPKNIQWHLSRMIRMYSIRYPENDAPSEVLLPLVAAMIARMVSVELPEEIAQTIFLGCDTLEMIYDHFDNNGYDSTTSQAKRFAAATLFMTKIFYGETPHFYRRDANFPALLILKKDANLKIPEEFRRDPSHFIENSRNILRGEPAERASHFYLLNQYHLDAGRVKRFDFGDVSIVSKRVEAFRVQSIEEEILEAERFGRFLGERGILNCRTVEYLGIVYDAGNFYILMRNEGDETLSESGDRLGGTLFDNMRAELEPFGFHDFEEWNVFHRKGTLVFFDFEGHVDEINVQKLPPDSNAITFAMLSGVPTEEELVRLGLHRDPLPVVERFRNALALKHRALRGPLAFPINAAISDIHGNADRLRVLHDHPDIASADRRIYLGDYFDRDGDGRRVFKMLESGDPNDRYLLGNHELYFLLAMAGDESSFVKWLADGGLDFLDGVMDLGAFSEKFFEAKAGLRDKSGIHVSDIVEAVREKFSGIFNDFFMAVRRDEFLKEVANWLIEKCGFYHVDEYGLLYIHAGIMATGGLDMGYLDRLGVYERGIISLLGTSFEKDNEEARQQLMDMTSRARRHLEIREYGWISSRGKNKERELFDVVSGIGVRGLVYGHTQRGRISNNWDRLFNIDMSMGRYYGGFGGALLVSPNGMTSLRFANMDSDEITSEPVLQHPDFMEMLREDSPSLIRAYQEYFMHLAGVG